MLAREGPCHFAELLYRPELEPTHLVWRRPAPGARLPCRQQPVRGKTGLFARRFASTDLRSPARPGPGGLASANPVLCRATAAVLLQQAYGFSAWGGKGVCSAAVNCAVSWSSYHTEHSRRSRFQRASKRKILALVHVQVYADDILFVWADPNAQVTTAPLIAFTQQDRIQGG